MHNYKWGIDLGGTKIELAVLDEQNNLEVKFRNRILTESDKGYNHILNQIETLVRQAENVLSLKADKIGIGTPGTLDPKTQNLKNSNTVCLNGMPFKKDLQNKLGLQLRLANDANCFAIAETKLGVVKERGLDPEIVFGVILGTGVGGGVVMKNGVHNGLHGIGGEWGHNFLDMTGGLCYCGKVGCVEKVISGTALEAWFDLKSGKPKPLKEIVKLAREGKHIVARDTLKRLYINFGKAISVVLNILDPDVVIIGGGVGNIDELYTEGLEEVKKHIFNSEVNTQFLKPSLGDSAGVFGAALLWN